MAENAPVPPQVTKPDSSQTPEPTLPPGVERDSVVGVAMIEYGAVLVGSVSSKLQ
jgi:hypothetical protein